MGLNTARRVIALLATGSLLVAPQFGARAVASPKSASGPVRGGTLHVGFSGSMVSLDPAQAYSDDWVIMQGTLFNALYQFDRNAQPQLDLAAAPPTISADHLVWTFKLRQGVQFSNGQELTADDVAFTLTRVLDPHLKPAVSWGQSADEVFKGWQDYVAGKAKTVAGIEALDKYTVRFTLSKPLAVFPSVLAESINQIVPKSVVTAEGSANFGNKPIGTGPFTLQSWKKGSQLIFLRNPHYFHAGKPYLDKIIADTDVSQSVIALKIQKGEYDGVATLNEIAPADMRQFQSDPKLATYVHPAPPIQAIWLDLNVHADPLSNLKLRQAIAMAINRNRLVKVIGGNASPANQIFIALDTQHDPALDAHPIYPYDPTKAAALVKASGYTGQPINILYATDILSHSAMAPVIQQDLQQIGLKVTLRGANDTAALAIGAKLTGHQLAFNSWSVDYPDAYDLYTGVMNCANNADGGPSAAHYCDSKADSLVENAQSLPLGRDRDAMMRKAQVRIIQSAAKIPLLFTKSAVLASPRIGGFFVHPLFQWQYENYWIKP